MPTTSDLLIIAALAVLTGTVWLITGQRRDLVQRLEAALKESETRFRVQAVQSLNVGPDEALVLYVTTPVTEAALAQLREQIRRMFPPGMRMLVIDEGVRLSKLTIMDRWLTDDEIKDPRVPPHDSGGNQDGPSRTGSSPYARPMGDAGTASPTTTPGLGSSC